MEIMLSRLNERWTILWLCNQMGQFASWDGQGECVTTTTKRMCFVLIMKDTSMVKKTILSNAKTVRSHSRLDGLTFCDCISENRFGVPRLFQSLCKLKNTDIRYVN